MTLVRYHEAAEDELLHEIGYLELQAKGLGHRFLAEVRKAEKFISRFPQSGSEIVPGIRKHILQKFRYSIIYSAEEEGILILAIAHHSRRPGYWVARAAESSRDTEHSA